MKNDEIFKLTPQNILVTMFIFIITFFTIYFVNKPNFVETHIYYLVYFVSVLLFYLWFISSIRKGKIMKDYKMSFNEYCNGFKEKIKHPFKYPTFTLASIMTLFNYSIIILVCIFILLVANEKFDLIVINDYLRLKQIIISFINAVAFSIVYLHIVVQPNKDE